MHVLFLPANSTEEEEEEERGGEITNCKWDLVLLLQSYPRFLREMHYSTVAAINIYGVLGK